MTSTEVEKLIMQVELSCREEDGQLACSGELPRIVKQGRKYFVIAVDPAVEYSEVDPDVAKYIEKLEEENAKLRRELEELKRKLAEIEKAVTEKTETNQRQRQQTGSNYRSVSLLLSLNPSFPVSSLSFYLHISA